MSLRDSLCLIYMDVRHRNKDHKSINTYLRITKECVDTVQALEMQGNFSESSQPIRVWKCARDVTDPILFKVVYCRERERYLCRV